MPSGKTSAIVAATVLALSLTGCATTSPGAETMAQARDAWIEQDYEQAMILMAREAELGNPEAQYALGYMYYNGQGTEVDIERALELITRAAEQGHSPAIRALSELATLSAHTPRDESRGDRLPGHDG